MKILHVIPSVSPRRGGPSSVVSALVTNLSSAGIDVHVATTDDDGDCRAEVPHGVPIRRDGGTYWFFPRSTRTYTCSWALSRWLSSNISEYDIVHIHALFSFTSTCAAYWAHRRNVPYIVRPLGSLNRWGIRNRRPVLKQLSFRTIEKRMLAGAAAIHFTSGKEQIEASVLSCMSKSTRSSIVANPVVIPEPLDIAPSASETVSVLRTQYPRHRNRTWILFLSRFDQVKGLDVLLPAFANVSAQHRNTTLVLAGDGDRELVQSLKRQALTLGLEDDIIWTGFLSGDEKQAAFYESDIFVLPSRSENFGVAALEAMAYGLPVVLSENVPISTEVQTSNAGLVVSCDIAQLSQALAALVRDATLRKALGSNGQALARVRFSPYAVTSEVIALYHRVLQNRT